MSKLLDYLEDLTQQQQDHGATATSATCDAIHSALCSPGKPYDPFKGRLVHSTSMHDKELIAYRKFFNDDSTRQAILDVNNSIMVENQLSKEKENTDDISVKLLRKSTSLNFQGILEEKSEVKSNIQKNNLPKAAVKLKRFAIVNPIASQTVDFSALLAEKRRSPETSTARPLQTVNFFEVSDEDEDPCVIMDQGVKETRDTLAEEDAALLRYFILQLINLILQLITLIRHLI